MEPKSILDRMKARKGLATHEVTFAKYLDMVEDDPRLSRAIEAGLESQRVSVTAARDLASGRRAAALNSYDVLVLDVMLPDGSGFDLCRQLRHESLLRHCCGDSRFMGAGSWRG